MILSSLTAYILCSVFSSCVCLSVSSHKHSELCEYRSIRPVLGAHVLEQYHTIQYSSYHLSFLLWWWFFPLIISFGSCNIRNVHQKMERRRREEGKEGSLPCICPFVSSNHSFLLFLSFSPLSIRTSVHIEAYAHSPQKLLLHPSFCSVPLLLLLVVFHFLLPFLPSSQLTLSLTSILLSSGISSFLIFDDSWTTATTNIIMDVS